VGIKLKSGLSSPVLMDASLLDKAPEVIATLFDRTALRYDLMNNLMSGFSHHNTRRFALNLVRVDISKQGTSKVQALDLATGTGDFAFLLYERFGCPVIGIDFSKEMLTVAVHRKRKKGIRNPIKFMHGDILSLPFSDHTFSICTIGYAIRNVENTYQALKEIQRVTKPGGTLLVVEAMPHPKPFRRFLHHFYFAKMTPLLARFLSPGSVYYPAYKYFGESVSKYLVVSDFIHLMKKAGWKQVRQFPIVMGYVTVVQGIA